MSGLGRLQLAYHRTSANRNKHLTSRASRHTVGVLPTAGPAAGGG